MTDWLTDWLGLSMPGHFDKDVERTDMHSFKWRPTCNMPAVGVWPAVCHGHNAAL